MQTRPARELAMRLLEYGRCDWKDPDDSGVPLHKAIIRSGRAELAVKAADGLRKKRRGRSVSCFSMGRAAFLAFVQTAAGGCWCFTEKGHF